jgi:hypothetical protein
MIATLNTHGQADSVQRRKREALYFLTGEWRVDANSRLSGGVWEKSQGSSRFMLMLDSALLEEEYIGMRQGKEFRSKTFFAVNNLTFKYQRMFIDAPHGVILDFEGEREGNKWIFDKLIKFPNGNEVTIRVVYTKFLDTSFMLESMRKPKGTEQWDTTSRMTYTKLQK